MPPPCNPTEGPIGSGFELDFFTATVTNNNLGGFGPDSGARKAENIRFSGVGEVDGESIDMVVTADANYLPSNSAQNKINGKFAQINLMSNREASMEFCFEKTSNGQAVTLDTFSFVFHGERTPPPAPLAHSPPSFFSQHHSSFHRDPDHIPGPHTARAHNLDRCAPA